MRQGTKPVLRVAAGLCATSLAMFGPTSHAGAQAAADVERGRVFGLDRFETAAEAALASSDGADTVVLARGDVFADSLCGNGLAGAIDAPVLLTRPNGLPAPTVEALNALAPERIILLGGTGAISNDVEQVLDADFEVERLGGRDRFETCARINGFLAVAEVGLAPDLPSATPIASPQECDDDADESDDDSDDGAEVEDGPDDEEGEVEVAQTDDDGPDDGDSDDGSDDDGSDDGSEDDGDSDDDGESDQCEDEDGEDDGDDGGGTAPGATPVAVPEDDDEGDDDACETPSGGATPIATPDATPDGDDDDSDDDGNGDDDGEGDDGDEGCLRTAIVASGETGVDALAAGPLAYKGGFPVFLVSRGGVSAETSAAVEALGIEQVIIVGGPAAVAPAVETSLDDDDTSTVRVLAGDRFETAAQLARLVVTFFDTPGAVNAAQASPSESFDGADLTIARGDDFADALAGAQFAAEVGAPLGLVNPCAVPAATSALVDDLSGDLQTITIFGGEAAVCEDAAAALEAEAEDGTA